MARAAERRADRRRARRRRWPPPTCRRRAVADALAAEVTEHARRWAGRTRSATTLDGARPADGRAAAAARRRWTSAALYELAGRLEDHLRSQVGARGADRGRDRPPGAVRAAAPGLDLDAAARRPGRPGSSSAAAPAASARRPRPRRSALRAAEARPRRSSSHHRPGPPAGPVARPDRAGQRPRARSTASTPRPAASCTR